MPSLPEFSKRADEPIFAEPWEAHAFALAVRLSDAGYFTWPEWTTFLAQEIEAAKQQNDPGVQYYQQWLAALEKICARKGLTTNADMAKRKAQFKDR